MALKRKNLTGVYSDEIFKEQNKMIEDQIKLVHASKDEALIEKYNLEAITAFMYAKFSDLSKSYREASLDQKKILLSSIFPAELVWTYPGILNSGISPFYSAISSNQDRGVLIGADERTSFEPDFARIVAWLIDNPSPTWLSRINEAGRASKAQLYAY